MLNHYQIILAVGAFIFNSRKQILIVKKSPHEMIDAGFWTIPGGKINFSYDKKEFYQAGWFTLKEALKRIKLLQYNFIIKKLKSLL